jgi:hypothetical protein
MNTTNFNKGFIDYKNKHKGKSAMILTHGPSIANFPANDINLADIKLGLSWTFQYADHLDYYFYGSGYHYIPGTSTKSKKVDDYALKIDNLPTGITKFASVYRNGIPTGLGNIEPSAATANNSIPFDCQLPTLSASFVSDIEKYKIFGLSIIFPALQFLLYTGIQRLYLVGVDANVEGHLYPAWQAASKFIETNYPDVEVVSINPVRLKGIFNDVYLK